VHGHRCPSAPRGTAGYNGGTEASLVLRGAGGAQQVGAGGDHGDARYGAALLAQVDAVHVGGGQHGLQGGQAVVLGQPRGAIILDCKAQVGSILGFPASQGRHYCAVSRGNVRGREGGGQWP